MSSARIGIGEPVLISLSASEARAFEIFAQERADENRSFWVVARERSGVSASVLCTPATPISIKYQPEEVIGGDVQEILSQFRETLDDRLVFDLPV